MEWKAEDIKAFRKELKLTQKEFAELIGVARNYVYYLEAGKRKASKMLCNFLDCLKEQMKGGK